MLKIIRVRLSGIRIGLSLMKNTVKLAKTGPKAIKNVGTQQANPVKKLGKKPKIPLKLVLTLHILEI